GFQQVIHRVDFEGADGMLIVGGGKDHRDLRTDQFKHLEPIQLRHLHVEKHEVRLELGNRLYCVETITALTHDVDLGMSLQHLADHLSREFLVIHDDGANGCVCFHAICAGSCMDT